MRSRLVILALVIAAARLAAAGPLSVVGDARAIDGVGSDDTVRLGIGGAGLRWRVAPTLDVQMIVLALVSVGDSELGDPARAGAGGELAARVMPWPRLAVRPYAIASVGGLLFPRRPFLPGGDFYEAILGFGAGAEIALGGRWTASAHVVSVHLSNGQGLGPFNPAYDGYGISASAAYRVGDAAAASEGPARPVEAPPSDVAVDAAIGNVDGAWFASARVRPGLVVGRHVTIALDAEAGALDTEPFSEIGLDAIGRAGPIAGAVHGGYRRYVGIDTAVMTAQIELAVTPETTLVVMGHHERPDLFESLWRAAAGLRLAPTSTLIVDLGVGFDRLGDDTVFGGDHSDPYLGFEWRSPWGVGQRRVCLFVEAQVSTLDIVGIRFAAPAGPAWRRVR